MSFSSSLTTKGHVSAGIELCRASPSYEETSSRCAGAAPAPRSENDQMPSLRDIEDSQAAVQVGSRQLQVIRGESQGEAGLKSSKSRE